MQSHERKVFPLQKVYNTTQDEIPRWQERGIGEVGCLFRSLGALGFGTMADAPIRHDNPFELISKN